MSDNPGNTLTRCIVYEVMSAVDGDERSEGYFWKEDQASVYAEALARATTEDASQDWSRWKYPVMPRNAFQYNNLVYISINPDFEPLPSSSVYETAGAAALANITAETHSVPFISHQMARLAIEHAKYGL